MQGDSTKRPNRKRKKSFIGNAKKYGKKGCYGRGSQLEPDLYNYLVEVISHFKTTETDEEKNLFANNVFAQIEGNEENCCFNQVGCRVIESLMPFSTESVFDKFMEIISNDLRKSCSDTYASHIVEVLYLLCFKKIIESKDLTSIEKEINFTLKVAKFLLNNLEDFMWNSYANHTLRTIILTFSLIDDKSFTKVVSLQLSDIETDNKSKLFNDYSEFVKDLAERILLWPQFLELAYSDLTSGLLQILIKSIAKLHPKLFKSYFKKTIDDCFVLEFNKIADANDFENKIFPKPVITLLESFLESSTLKIFTKIYVKCFHSKLGFLAKTKETNFAVQKLLDYCKEKTEFEAIFDELVEHIEKIFEKNHTGVILSLGKACKRLAAKQGSFLTMICKLFNCLEPQERQQSLILCLTKWKKFENLNDEKSKIDNETNKNIDKCKIHLHGTLIIQLLLNFNKPIKIVNSILNLETNLLLSIFCDPMGCHITDSFAQSPFVGEKSRERLLRKMQGNYRELVVSKYGSRSFDALWDVANLKIKSKIMEELAPKNAAWTNTLFGKIIATKVHLNLYIQNNEEWKNTINNSKEKKSLIDIFK